MASRVWQAKQLKDKSFTHRNIDGENTIGSKRCSLHALGHTATWRCSVCMYVCVYRHMSCEAKHGAYCLYSLDVRYHKHTLVTVRQNVQFLFTMPNNY